jgi:hypothetical protein
MTAYIKIKSGSYRNQPIVDAVFPLLKQYQSSPKGGFVTVQNVGAHAFASGGDKVRINVDGMLAYELVSEAEFVAQGDEPIRAASTVATVIQETDDEIMARMRDAFSVLDDMAKAATQGNIRAMIVSGPPGVGKSYGVEKQVERANLAGKLGRSEQDRCEFVKGACTPIALYKTLYKHRDSKHLVVFDDTDSILYDELSLNILKAALDTGKKRRVSWNAESRILKEEDIPNSFDFQGAVIFITNISLENVRGKIKDHVEALFSRCHVLNLGIKTRKEVMLRIRQVATECDLFENYNITEEQKAEVMEFVYENCDKFHELSLRTALKAADLIHIKGDAWQKAARFTLLK